MFQGEKGGSDLGETNQHSKGWKGQINGCGAPIQIYTCGRYARPALSTFGMGLNRVYAHIPKAGMYNPWPGGAHGTLWCGPQHSCSEGTHVLPSLFEGGVHA